MDTEVSLEEILNVLGEAVDERAAWALLVQACKALHHWTEILREQVSSNLCTKMRSQCLTGSAEYSNPGSRLFITPESILLNRKGMVTFSAGIPDSKYMAPESLSKNTLDSSELQKSCIYSLGVTLTVAIHYGDKNTDLSISEQLQTLLAHMTAADQEDRSSMEELSQYIEQKESTEEVVCNLVSLVLGDPQLIPCEEENLEAEILGVLNSGPVYDSGASSSVSIFSDEALRQATHEDAGMYSSLPAIAVVDSIVTGSLHSPSDNHLTASHYRPPREAQSQSQYQSSKKAFSYGSHFYTPSRRKRERKPYQKKEITNLLKRSSSEEKNTFSLPIGSSAGGVIDDHTRMRSEKVDGVNRHNVSPHDVGPHDVSAHDVSPHDVSPHDVSAHDVSPHDVSPHDVSAHDVSAYDVSAHDVSPHDVSAHDVSPHDVSPVQASTHGISPIHEDGVSSIHEASPYDVHSIPDIANTDTESGNQLFSEEPPPKYSSIDTTTGQSCPFAVTFEAAPIPDIVITTKSVSSDYVRNTNEISKISSIEDHFHAELEGSESINEQVVECENSSTTKQVTDEIQDIEPSMQPISQSSEATNDRSFKKLGHILGPEFCTLHGLSTIKMNTKITPSAKKSYKSLGQRRAVEVILLNGQAILFHVDVNSTCRDLFNQVVALQSLEETYIFGLALIRNITEDNEVFLEFDSKLSEYAPKQWGRSSARGLPFRLFFRVKYYVENVNQLRLDQTRHLYYLQLRRDILDSKTYCSEQSALSLAAFAIQAEIGDFSTTERSYKLEDYLPRKVIIKLGEATAMKALTDLHCELKGLSQAESQLNYMMECQTLPEYGMVFYQVATSSKEKLGSIWLGLSVRGIVMYNVHKGVKTPFTHWPWCDLKNLSYANKKFIIEPEHGKTTKFHTESHKIARYILHLSIYYHRFQLLMKNQASSLVFPTEQVTDGATKYTEAKVEKRQDCKEIPNEVIRLTQSTGLEALLHLPDGEIYDIELVKTKNALGLRLAGGHNKPTGGGYIYVKAIETGSIADKSCVKENDILLKVDGKSLYGMTHKDAASFISEAKHSVFLQLLRPGDSKWLNKTISMDQSWSEAQWSIDSKTHVTLDSISENTT